MTVKIIEAERVRTPAGCRVTRITFSPCGHQRSIGGWERLPSEYLGEERADCGQGPCLKAGA